LLKGYSVIGRLGKYKNIINDFGAEKGKWVFERPKRRWEWNN
jgi:hypothetical protein